jgi:hypothetical protein
LRDDPTIGLWQVQKTGNRKRNSCLGKYHRIEVVYHTWPKQKEGTTAAPASIATFTKPYLFLRNTTCKLEEAQ